MIEPEGILGEIARRKRWEREILRDALASNLRVPPDSPWLPSADALKTARRYLKQGGCAEPRRSLLDALEDAERITVIAEAKRRSPSAGAFASWTDPEPLAELYEEGGAAAMSVLTDAHYFDGRPAFLARCRPVFSGPLLRKDFLVNEADLAISAALGADAVLFIVALVGKELPRLLKLARDFGLQTLVEVHDEAELDRALVAGAPLIGVNNRDLRTFKVDLETSERLGAKVPAPFLLVAESGIRSPADALRMRKAGADAILVGEALASHGGEGLVEMRVEAPRGVRG